MMRQSYLLAPALFLLLQACNSSSDSKDAGAASNYSAAPTAAAGTMSQTDAATFKGGEGKELIENSIKDLQGEQAISQGAGGITAGTPPTSFTARALLVEEDQGANEDCSHKTVEGDTTDADTDGILDNATQSIDCTVKGDVFSWTAKGVVKWQDKDLEKKPGGFTLTFGPYHSEYTTTAEGQDATFAFDSVGTFDVTRDGATMTSKTEFGNYVKQASTEASFEFVYGSFYTQVFTSENPDATGSDFFANGTLSMDGFYRSEMKGGHTSSSEGQNEYNRGFTLKIEGKDLVRKSSCTAAFFDSGSFTFTDGAGNVIKATFENCAETWTYNGNAI